MLTEPLRLTSMRSAQLPEATRTLITLHLSIGVCTTQEDARCVHSYLDSMRPHFVEMGNATYMSRFETLRGAERSADLLKDFRKAESLPGCNVAVLEFGDSSIHQIRHIKSTYELREYWAVSRPDGITSNIRGRLYVVEDLSKDIMDEFGIAFNIHPGFFAKHLWLPVFTKKESHRSWIHRMPLRLLSSSKEDLDRTGLSLRYYDIERLTPGTWPTRMSIFIPKSNVKRRAFPYNPFDGSDFMISILRNISLHIVPTPESNPWSGRSMFERVGNCI
jgi:hypothetical protein